VQIKIILNIKMLAKGAPVFTFSLAGGDSPPSVTPLERTWVISELQIHHCITSKQWTWLLCRVSFTSVVARI